ncbi:hypothetical protein MAR_021443 [Mya arenaria]|uniref:Uncharacterized protein n=1 Tax=Mya arenaria TaxID=6604 RepID=A0ABY7EA90_MYAAR|nr:hypothetical protein MAR_021443 [Mya arenaria]
MIFVDFEFNHGFRKTLLCSLRDQAETYAYGIPSLIKSNYDMLFSMMEQRFGIINMKDSYVADAKLRRKQKNETYRKFGQAIGAFYRKAYSENSEITMSHFLDNCHEPTEFRISAKRTRPKSLQDAVTAAMQEECLRLSERDKLKDKSCV